VHSLRHVLSAAACVTFAVVGLTACVANADDTSLPTTPVAAVPATTAPPTTAAPTFARPTATPTVAPSTAPTTTSAPTRTAPRAAPPPSTSRPAPAPDPKPAPEPAPVAADTSVAGQVLTLVNAERARAGCDPVALDDRLTRAAAAHSQDMAADNFFSHDSRDGRGFDDRIEATGYPAPRSENIAAGQPTAAAVMDAWMNSPGHKANILDCTATQMGLASATGGDFGIYWTQNFGTA
jgi:uncharacterized protein YkwD